MENNNGTDYPGENEKTQNTLNKFADMVEKNGMYVYGIHITPSLKINISSS